MRAGFSIVSTKEISYKVAPPTSPDQLRLILFWHHLERQSGDLPAEADHGGKIGRMYLHVSIDATTQRVLLRGHSPIFTHPARLISLTNSEHDAHFSIACMNRNAFVANQVLWSRTISNSELKMKIVPATAVIGLEGECINCKYTDETFALDFTINAKGCVVSMEGALPGAVVEDFLKYTVE
jgi:hypothetical protein